MPLLSKLKYDKIEAWRSAKLFLIVCEGEKRERQYFDFFDGLDPRLTVIAIPSEGGRSAPNHLQINAEKAVAEKVNDGGEYELWLVLDIDTWDANTLHDIHKMCKNRAWFVAVSNPCFEVWLYYHFKKNKPDLVKPNLCKSWKRLLPEIESGGFDIDYHPTLIRQANENAKRNYTSEGYIPDIGTTQLYELGEKIYELTKRVLDEYDR